MQVTIIWAGVSYGGSQKLEENFRQLEIALSCMEATIILAGVSYGGSPGRGLPINVDGGARPIP